jgi:hypothetical protein
MKIRALSVALLLACLSAPAIAAWVSSSGSTTNGLTVSPGQDISGYVGHVSDSTYQTKFGRTCSSSSPQSRSQGGPWGERVPAG